ncbi:MAG: replication initiator protein [Arizlama microvirus]|nr:MAG: replication initiator protein [Arizlama microvirus]
MLCRNPWLKDGIALPCGQCMPCRINRKRIWTHRIMLETLQHGDNAFVTLTYKDEQLPITPEGKATLVPKHVQDWLKRFRKRIEPMKIRYYLVGEYGDNTQRPHYHVALFGYPSCRFGISRYATYRPRCCIECDTVLDTWGMGQVMLGTLEDNSANYIAGYVTKKMTAKDDQRLEGRHPEFARMSLRPGIGAEAMHEVASALLQFNLECSEVDVPSSLRHGARILPLGRYLRQKLRTMIGKEVNAPAEVLEKMAKELQELYPDTLETVTTPKGRTFTRINEKKLQEEIVKAADQKVLQMETRQKIYRSRKTI